MLREMKRDKHVMERKREERRIFPGVIAAAFIASAITFFLLLNIERNALSDYEKVVVWIASANIPKAAEINSGNMESCFKQVEVDKSGLPEYVITDIHSLEGNRTTLMIPEGTILSEPMFTDDTSYVDSLTNPVIVGCKADDLYQVVSGILRKGDIVNVYTVNDELGETYLLWEDVLIDQTFDNAGNLIVPEDVTTAAARINLLMEEGYAEQFYTELNKGSLRMVKVWNS